MEARFWVIGAKLLSLVNNLKLLTSNLNSKSLLLMILKICKYFEHQNNRTEIEWNLNGFVVISFESRKIVPTWIEILKCMDNIDCRGSDREKYVC